MGDSDASRRAPVPAPPFDLGTELGRDLAAVDWDATGVGPWSQWSTSLANTVRLMIASRFSMWLAWGDGLTFFCNDAYRRDTLGEKYPWALGRPSAQVWSEIWDEVGPRIDSVLSTGVATWDENLQLFLERSGYQEETYHTFSYSPVHEDDGRIAGMLCVVTENTGEVIGDRRMALLRDVGSALSVATTRDAVALGVHAHLSGDVPDVPFAVGYLLDPDSPDALGVHWSTGAAVGGPATPARLLRGDGHPWSAAVFTDGPDGPVVELDPAISWPTGRWRDPPTRALALPLRQISQPEPYGYVVVGLNPYRALDDDYRGFVELLADQLASALARVEAFEQERDRHAQLAELDRAKTTFFTNISHELRTPLTLLLGPAEDALTDADHPLDPAQQQRVQVIARNGARLLKLVNTLLDFSRLEAGRMTARFEPLDLHRFTAELATMFDSAYARAGLTLQVTTEPLPARPYVDREMWAKVVLNLLSNALKATFEGGVSVRLTDDPTSDSALLEVTDTGVGIPAAEVDRLFERFHRVAGARQRSHEGSGIGLALVGELVRLHGGDIQVRSSPGQGSTFTVRMPYGDDHLPPDQVVHDVPQDLPDVAGLGAGYVAESLRWSATDEAPAPAPSDDDARHLLVVDDSPDVREYVQGLLAPDYRVSLAGDGEQALAAIRTDPPDLVITDVMMPELDGFGLLAAIRADPAVAHLPVIMLSARSGDAATVEGLEAGADDYLVKPFTARELRARVRANLELDRVRQVLAELERNRDMLDNAERLARLGSWEVDLRSRTMRVSPQLARTSGLAAEPHAPLSWDDALARTGPEEGRLRAAIDRTLSGGGDLDEELWLPRRTGEPFRARVRAVVVRDESGTPRFLRGSTQDVTEQRAAEAELAAAHVMREVSAREHTIATELQRSLLPDLTFDAAQLEIAAFYRAGVEGTQVGGDWYDVIDLGMGRTALLIGDVMGRGVRAAAVMGQLRAAARAYARLSLPADELLRLLDDTVRDIGDDTIVTCVFAVYDPAAKTLDYANAGHVPPLLIEAGQPVRRLESGGPPLGAGQHANTGAHVAFPTGAVLALYTDGLVERRDRDLDDGIDQLADRLTDGLAPTDRPLAGLPGAIVDSLLTDGTSDDDVAVLVCRAGARAPGEHDARHEVGTGEHAVSAARRFVVDHLTEWGVRPADEYDVQLAVSELVTNAITHGAPPIELHLRLAGGRARLSVRDSGDGRPVMRRSGPRDAHGRGLLIVATLADVWGIGGGSSGKTVWCEIRLHVDAASPRPLVAPGR